MAIWRRRLFWVSIYAVAMAYVEAAVVVYLRAIYYPQGFAFPLVRLEPHMAAIEIGREAATLAMLLGVAALAGTDRWERFLAFCLGFGIWDIFYYVWLWVTLGWPPSLLTWDILFLIPVPWAGPVLAPLLISLGLVGGALLLLRLHVRGVRLVVPWPLWVMAVAGGVLVLGSFMLDFRMILEPANPPPFRWGLFAAGMALGTTALFVGVGRLERGDRGRAL